MLPIYLSAPAFNLVAMTSYTNFSFLQHLRISAFSSEQAIAIAPQSPSIPSYADDDTEDPSDVMGSWKQGLAETCFFYSQNLPTLGLLLPRAGLSLALLLAFSTPAELFVASGQRNTRDTTFFSADGTLTDYAKGVLITNIAWTAWRTLVLLVSWQVVNDSELRRLNVNRPPFLFYIQAGPLGLLEPTPRRTLWPSSCLG